MDTFSERLKYLRSEKGISQTDLAKAIGLSHGVIHLWETGKRVPNANAVIALADYFHVTTDYLLGVSDNP